VRLGHRLKHLAPGLGTRSALEKFSAVQMIDVRIPTSDGRELALTRYTQPEPDQHLLLERLKLTVPAQPPPSTRVDRTNRLRWTEVSAKSSANLERQTDNT
jgi:hypothetical protein